MIYWKDECTKLASAKAKVVVVDDYDSEGVPRFVIFEVLSAIGSRSGKNAYWNVMIGGAMSDGCSLLTYPHILAYNNGTMVYTRKLEQYHPAWKLSEAGNRKLEMVRDATLMAIRSELAKIPVVDIFHL